MRGSIQSQQDLPGLLNISRCTAGETISPARPSKDQECLRDGGQGARTELELRIFREGRLIKVRGRKPVLDSLDRDLGLVVEDGAVIATDSASGIVLMRFILLRSVDGQGGSSLTGSPTMRKTMSETSTLSRAVTRAAVLWRGSAVAAGLGQARGDSLDSAAAGRLRPLGETARLARGTVDREIGRPAMNGAARQAGTECWSCRDCEKRMRN